MVACPAIAAWQEREVRLRQAGPAAEMLSAALLLGAAHLLAAATLLLIAAVVCFGALALGVLPPGAQLLLNVIHIPQRHL